MIWLFGFIMGVAGFFIGLIVGYCEGKHSSPGKLDQSKPLNKQPVPHHLSCY